MNFKKSLDSQNIQVEILSYYLIYVSISYATYYETYTGY